MHDKLKRLKEIDLESEEYCLENNLDFEILPQYQLEYSNLWSSIRIQLLQSPGLLIYQIDTVEKQILLDIWIDIVDSTLQDEDAFLIQDALNSDVLESAIERAKKMTPQFMKIDPKTLDFGEYFQQAVKAYLYGLHNASLIIICSFLESALKEKLNEFNLDVVDLKFEIDDKGNRNPIGVCINFIDIINKCYNKHIITARDKNSLHRIRKLRNNVIHEGKSISYEETLTCIKMMKEIFENLFKE